MAFSVRQVTEKNKTPFLLLATVADNVLDGGLHYCFRMQPNARAMATLTVGNMIEMAKSAGTPIKRVAIMHEDGNFGTTMGNHVEAFAGKMGYELVQRVPYNLRSPDFTAELSKVKAARPDLLVISGYYGDSKIIAETAAKLRIGVHALVGLANAAYSNPSSSPRTVSSPTSSSTATTGTTPRAPGPARCSTRTRSASAPPCPTTGCRATR